MFTVSNRWRNAVTYGVSTGAEVRTYVDIVDSSGQYVVSNLDIIGGSVTVDRSRANRRECSLSIQDASGNLVPNEIDDLLQPLAGYYMKPYRGFRYKDGTEEVVPLGTFAPSDPKVSETADSLDIAVTGSDRSKLISRIRWTEPYPIASGKNLALAVRDAVQSRMSGISMAFRPTNSTTPLVTFGTQRDNDPWKDISELASADGFELYFDANDVLRLEPAAEDVDTVRPVMRFDDGETCTVEKFDRTLDTSTQYTGVVVTSESSDIVPPIRVEVWRQDTRLRIPYFLTSSLIKTNAQAVAAGAAQLRRSMRGEIAVGFSAVPDPSLEVDDVIAIASQRSRIDANYTVSSMTMPLDATSTMTVNTSKRRM